MIVEPFAAYKLDDNLNPIGRAFYGASTLLCTPGSRSQEVGLAPVAQAGEKRLRDVVTSGRFSRFRRATETPFNNFWSARKSYYKIVCFVPTLQVAISLTI
jgi:hypothetical protein